MKHWNIVINQKPGQAAVQKGHSCLPEDFEKLRAGENFVLWREGDVIKVETTLSENDLWLTLDAVLKASGSQFR